MRFWVGVIGAMSVLALGLVPPASLRAQGVTTAAVSGTVTGPNGQPLAGAQVTATDTRTGASQRGVTNANGRFFIPSLQPGGPYTVQAQVLGYRPERRTGIVLRLGEMETLTFSLQQAAVQLDALQVIAEVDPEFSASRTGTSTTISEDEIDRFPTINRNFADFASLSPHVSLTEGAPSVGGQNNRFNNIQIDGAANNDVFGLADSGIPGGQAGAKAISLEAIQEFQVLTAPFDVRHANFTGGLINAVTKSGTNEFTGSVFAFRTDESLVSKLDTVPVGEFNDTQFGFSFGGPIKRDRVHFFAAGEFQLRDQPNPGPGFDPTGAASQPGAQEAGVDPADAQRLIDIMRNTYGVDAGTTAAISNDNPRTNLFGRIDWRLNDRHRVVLRHNYSRARVDLSAFRTTFSFALTSNLAPFTSITNSSVAQLFSQLGDRWNNELLVNLEFIRDERDPLVQFSAVEVDVGSNTLVAGAEQFSHGNSLDQTVFQLTNNLTGSFGDHLITFGTHNEFFDFNNLFFPASLGVYEFDSLDDLENNQPSEYLINTAFPGVDDVAAKFSVLQLGGYVQDEWRVSDNLNLTFGLRVDVPLMLDDPRENPDFLSAFGISTAQMPSGNLLWQPRFGFNWNSLRERQTQVRGGAGLFAGRPPYVWLANAYGNTGQSTLNLICQDANAPGFDPSSPAPTACVDGSTAVSSGAARVDFFDNDFRFPLDFKANLAVDQELGAGFSVTVEGLYTKSIEQFFFEEFNLTGQQGTDPAQGGRPVFGTRTSGGYDPARRDDNFAHVIRATNTSDNEAFLLSVELKRQFSDWLRFRGSYTYSDVEDTQGLFSSQATSNFGRNPIGGDPNDPPLTTSPFERPHRIVLSATGRWMLGRRIELEVTPQYFGQSGNPYSFGTREDVNGDGYRGPGISRDNDLLYIPATASEIAFRDPADAALLDDLISSQSCLTEQRGQIMQRNTCRNPWTNQLDLQVALSLPSGPGNIQIVANAINLLENKLERTNNIDRVVEVLRARGRVGGDPDADFIFDYTGPTRDPDTGELNPFTTFSPASNRQFQLGVRYNF